MALAGAVPPARHLDADAGGLPLSQPRRGRSHRGPRLRGLPRPPAQGRRGHPGQAAGGPRRRAPGLRPRPRRPRRARSRRGAVLRQRPAAAGRGSGQGGRGAGGGGAGADREPAGTRRHQGHPGAGQAAGRPRLLLRPRGPRPRRPGPGPAPRGGGQGPAPREPHARHRPAQLGDGHRERQARPVRQRRLPRGGAGLLRVRGAGLERLQERGAPAAGGIPGREPPPEPAPEPQRDAAAASECGRRRGPGLQSDPQRPDDRPQGRRHPPQRRPRHLPDARRPAAPAAPAADRRHARAAGLRGARRLARRARRAGGGPQPGTAVQREPPPAAALPAPWSPRL